ncbi:hypothetical protein MNBD_NITROSPINAE02-1567 [hydrothermal vent metagenome]|uniref:SH3b domain-containing protein n=1 Tax=hydrothermal vent metagenome TaxID=652676 RepID=A0A3B1BQQ7_9ZZZZ
MALQNFYRPTIIALCMGLLYAAPLRAGEDETVYAKRDQTAILAQPFGMAKIVAKAKEGEPLKVIGKSGKYYRVKTSRGVTGYVFSMRVTSDNPAGASPEDDDLGLADTGPKDRRSVALGESSASHSIRGLRKAPDKKGKGATKEMADKSLKNMERLKVSAGELDKFQREGNVGRYAR